MRRAWGGKVSASLQHLAPMCEHRAPPEVRIVHAFVWWSPTSVPFLDHHPKIFWGHPVFGQPLGNFGIGLCLKSTQYVVPRYANAPAGPAGMGSRPVVLYSSLSDSAR